MYFSLPSSSRNTLDLSKHIQRSRAIKVVSCWKLSVLRLLCRLSAEGSLWVSASLFASFQSPTLILLLFTWKSWLLDQLVKNMTVLFLRVFTKCFQVTEQWDEEFFLQINSDRKDISLSDDSIDFWFFIFLHSLKLLISATTGLIFILTTF